MSMTLNLDVTQRLNLEGMIRQQRSPDDETLMVNFELLKKVRIPTEERQIYARDVQTAQGTMTELYPKTIKAAPRIEIALESAEVRRLEALLKEWRNYSADDVEWLLDLKGQISAVNNGVAAPKRTAPSPLKKEAVS